MEAKKSLDWKDLRQLGKTDNGNRWYPYDDIAEYFSGIRSPSRAWPHSYAKAAMTQKFAKWLIANHQDLAARHGLKIVTAAI